MLDFRRERLPRDAGVGRRPEEEAGVEPEVGVAEEVEGTVNADLDVEDFSSAENMKKTVLSFLYEWCRPFIFMHLEGGETGLKEILEFSNPPLIEKSTL